MPTVAQVRELPELARVRVPSEWEDMNGHVNVQHHLGLYNLSGDALLDLLGISQDWVRAHRAGIVDLEHHIWFQHELHVGDEAAVHLRFTARTQKLTHGVAFIVDVSDDVIASAIEFLSIPMDLDARRAMPWPEVVGRRLDALVAEHEALAWPVPRCGSISV